MQEGVSAAYKAVMKPAEGTVLTVSRLAAKRAVEVAAEEKGRGKRCWKKPFGRAMTPWRRPLK